MTKIIEKSRLFSCFLTVVGVLYTKEKRAKPCRYKENKK